MRSVCCGATQCDCNVISCDIHPGRTAFTISQCKPILFRVYTHREEHKSDTKSVSISVAQFCCTYKMLENGTHQSRSKVAWLLSGVASCNRSLTTFEYYKMENDNTEKPFKTSCIAAVCASQAANRPRPIRVDDKTRRQKQNPNSVTECTEHFSVQLDRIITSMLKCRFARCGSQTPLRRPVCVCVCLLVSVCLSDGQFCIKSISIMHHALVSLYLRFVLTCNVYVESLRRRMMHAYTHTHMSANAGRHNDTQVQALRHGVAIQLFCILPSTRAVCGCGQVHFSFTRSVQRGTACNRRQWIYTRLHAVIYVYSSGRLNSISFAARYYTSKCPVDQRSNVCASIQHQKGREKFKIFKFGFANKFV